MATVDAAVHATGHIHHHFSGPHVDYVGVALAALASWIGLAGPGEAALIAAGIAAAHHKVDISGVLVVAWVGATLGGMTGWLIGLRAGRSLMTARGPLHRLRRALLKKGDEIYRRRGLLAVYFAPSWMAGISGMRASRFIPANAASALIWTLLIGLGSYWAGPAIAETLSDVGTVGTVLLVVVATVALIAQRRAHHRQRPD